MSCPACTKAAADPHTGATAAGCRGCTVRFIARSPKHVRERFYDIETQNHGAAGRILLIEDVKREHARLQALKARAV